MHVPHMQIPGIHFFHVLLCSPPSLSLSSSNNFTKEAMRKEQVHTSSGWYQIEHQKSYKMNDETRKLMPKNQPVGTRQSLLCQSEMQNYWASFHTIRPTLAHIKIGLIMLLRERCTKYLWYHPVLRNGAAEQTSVFSCVSVYAQRAIYILLVVFLHRRKSGRI